MDLANPRSDLLPEVGIVGPSESGPGEGESRNRREAKCESQSAINASHWSLLNAVRPGPFVSHAMILVALGGNLIRRNAHP